MSYATSTLATFAQMLGALDHLVGKAEQSGKPGLLEARLAPDMLPLATQVRLSTFQVLNTLNRLTGAGIDLPAEDPVTFDDAKQHIAAARAAVDASSAESFPDADAPVEFDIPNGMEFALKAHEYVRDWAMAQFYFHLTTFYAILRSQGVEVGKADFVPYMMRHIKKPAG